MKIDLKSATNEVLRYKNVIKNKDAYIQKLKRSCDHKDGVVEGLGEGLNKITKMPVNSIKTVNNHATLCNNAITNNNTNYPYPQIASLPINHIQPLTVSFIQSRLHEYTFESYRHKQFGLFNFIKNLVKYEVDGVMEQNLAITSATKFTGHRLADEKIWQEDIGTGYIHVILDELTPLANQYFDRVTARYDALEIWEKPNEEQSFQNYRSFTFGITDKQGQPARDKLFNEIRHEIRLHVFVGKQTKMLM